MALLNLSKESVDKLLKLTRIEPQYHKTILASAVTALEVVNNEELYQSLSVLTGVDTKSIQILTEAISDIYWELSRCIVKNEVLIVPELFQQIGLPGDIISIVSSVYIENKNRIAKVKSKSFMSHPRYANLAWRLDVELGRRSMHVMTEPKFMIRLDVSEPASNCATEDSHSLKSYHLEADYANMRHLNSKLEQALEEVESVHSQRIMREIDDSRLFFGDLASNCDEYHIRELLESHGYEVSSVKLMRGKNTMMSLNYGFVELSDRSESVKVISDLDSTLLLGRKIRVKFATPKELATDRKQVVNSRPSLGSPNSLFVKFNSLEVRVYDENQCHNLAHFVLQLGIKSTEESLRNVFSQFGEISDVNIKASKMHSIEPVLDEGYGFVHFSVGEEGIEEAFRALDYIGANPLIDGVNYACSASQHLISSIQKLNQRGQYENPSRDPVDHEYLEKRLKELTLRKEAHSKPKTPHNSLFVKFQAKKAGLIVTGDIIRKEFSKFGNVTNVFIKESKKDLVPRVLDEGFGFVDFSTSDDGIEEAFRAMDALTQCSVMNYVEYSCEASQHLITRFHDLRRRQKMEDSEFSNAHLRFDQLTLSSDFNSPRIHVQWQSQNHDGDDPYYIKQRQHFRHHQQYHPQHQQNYQPNYQPQFHPQHQYQQQQQQSQPHPQLGPNSQYNHSVVTQLPIQRIQMSGKSTPHQYMQHQYQQYQPHQQRHIDGLTIAAGQYRDQESAFQTRDTFENSHFVGREFLNRQDSDCHEFPRESSNRVHVKFHALEYGIKVTVPTLSILFSKFGDVVEISITFSKTHLVPEVLDEGWGFVCFSTSTEANTAVSSLSTTPIVNNIKYNCSIADTYQFNVDEKAPQSNATARYGTSLSNSQTHSRLGDDAKQEFASSRKDFSVGSSQPTLSENIDCRFNDERNPPTSISFPNSILHKFLKRGPGVERYRSNGSAKSQSQSNVSPQPIPFTTHHLTQRSRQLTQDDFEYDFDCHIQTAPSYLRPGNSPIESKYNVEEFTNHRGTNSSNYSMQGQGHNGKQMQHTQQFPGERYCVQSSSIETEEFPYSFAIDEASKFTSNSQRSLTHNNYNYVNQYSNTGSDQSSWERSTTSSSRSQQTNSFSQSNSSTISSSKTYSVPLTALDDGTNPHITSLIREENIQTKTVLRSNELLSYKDCCVVSSYSPRNGHESLESNGETANLFSEETGFRQDRPHY